MLNLFREFTELHLTGADGVPHQLVPYLGATEIVLGQGPIVFPLELVTPSSLSPATGIVGTTYTYQTPLYEGSGPITLTSFWMVNGQLINSLTGQPTTVEAEAIITGPGPFTLTPTVSGGVEIMTVATGADGIPVSSPMRLSVITVPAPPVFTQAPSLLPAVVAAGNPVTVNPGAGPNLVWTLTLNGADVRPQVQNGTFTSSTGGQLRLSSTITNAGGSVTQTVTSTITAPVVVPPDPTVEPTITMSQTGFTVEDAGEVAPATITPTEDGFTVQSN